MGLVNKEETTNNNRNTVASSSAASTVKSNNKNKAIAQYNADARLFSRFEQSAESGKSFDYTKSIKSVPENSVSQEEMTAYLSRIQRGGQIQPFGCMLTVEVPTFLIIAYSENATDLLLGLGLDDNRTDVLVTTAESSKFDGGLIGVDARTLFTPSSGASLVKAVASREISLQNPIWVHSKSTQKPFYAILHRIDVGIVIDLEPAKLGDPAFSLAGVVQSQKLAVRAISRLQSLPGGDIGVLCDTVVQNVQELTGYDRVMVYKFHEDEHGEVVSEIRRSDLEPYLGLHYPATDIPQAARFLFKQNRVRMICDCHAKPVGIVQSEALEQPLCLVNSTLRSPHGCHTQYMANMGSIASLVLAVIVNSGNSSETKLWGLLVCHHSSRRCIPFPVRYACEFLMQAFGLQLNMELQMAAQLCEKKILKMQTLLCDMLLRDSPVGIVTQSPNIMDLVKCDGAALHYGGMCWVLGVTPNEVQIKDILEWLLTFSRDSTGFCTDSLADAGYPGAGLLGDAVCGMAAARITSKDFLFWFRSHTAKEVKWGGAKHHPDNKDDGGRMHPRSSFKAFLEVVKCRSLPWEVPDMNAIYSLQLIMRGSIQDGEETVAKTIIQAEQNDMETEGMMEELSSVASEMVRLIETATAPILAVDSAGLINGWNAKAAELTGLAVIEAMGKSLVNELVHKESRVIVENHLSRALRGEEDKNIELKLKTFGPKEKVEYVHILANACCSRDYTTSVVGVCFVGQDVTEERMVTDKFVRLQRDYEAVIHSPNSLIPPIFASDENTCCCEWNAAMEKLTGWLRGEVIGKMLLREIFGDFCELKSQDALTRFTILLYRAIGGQDTERSPFSFFNKKGAYIEVLLTANMRVDASGHTIGCFCFLQDLVHDNAEIPLQIQTQQDQKCFQRKLAYLQRGMKTPLDGIRFTHKLLENSAISDDQKQVLETSEACERQIIAVIEDMQFRSNEEGCTKLSKTEFLLGCVMDAVVSQVMILLQEKNLQLIHDIPEKIKTVHLYGDQIRLQQVLSEFLLNTVQHAPSPGGWVEIKVSFNLNLTDDGIELLQLEFRMTHPGKGLPQEIVQDMFEKDGPRSSTATQEGLCLSMSRKLLRLMNGDVQYIREPTRCYFLVQVGFQSTTT
ncbi:hypothetical protein MKW98_014251 [Papaver atlanticum]|uniref:Phytochrome n=1 Tax=Papaver atlanticum TaxID=357466 RepID=A0AAD4SYB9_9MAGN|nr:hypothetical protein MKW98_014251 [Papaver atlanticum]